MFAIKHWRADNIEKERILLYPSIIWYYQHNYDGKYWAELILFKSDQRSKHSRGQQLIDANHQELNQKQV